LKRERSACWDDPLGGGISTQGDNLRHLELMIEEAIFCHFDEDEMPKIVMSNGWKKKIKFKDFSISLCFFVFFVANFF